MVSQLFDYTQSTLLGEFLYRFSRLDAEARGIDTRFSPGSPDDVDLARIHLAEYRLRPSESAPVMIITVPVEGQNGTTELHELVVWESMVEPDSIVGRCTLAYVAYNKTLGCVAFYKECWRSLSSVRRSEADVIRMLNKAGVRNVPTLIAGGDITGSETPLEFPDALYPSHGTVDIRIHSWIMIKEVGSELSTMRSTKELLSATRDAFIGES